MVATGLFIIFVSIAGICFAWDISGKREDICMCKDN